jgi:hypothetical protein
MEDFIGPEKFRLKGRTQSDKSKLDLIDHPEKKSLQNLI